MRDQTQLPLDPIALRKILSKYAALRDQIIIEQNMLIGMEVDIRPLGNLDPAILLKNLNAFIDEFPRYKKWGMLGSFMIPKQFAPFFECKVNGKTARSFESLQSVHRVLQQEVRLKELAVGVTDFFRAHNISVGKDNVLEVIQRAEMALRNAPNQESVITYDDTTLFIPQNRVPKPAKRPARRRPARSKVVK